MTFLDSRSRGRYAVGALALLTAALVPGLTQLPAVATPGSASAPAPAAAAAAIGSDESNIRTPGDPVAGLANLDLRGTALPSATQRRAAAALGVVDLRWNDFGTPASLLPADGALAEATSADPVVAARTWLSRNAAVFAMSKNEVASLEVVSSQPFALSPARAVLFRQKFGGLTPAVDSMVTVGVANGEIAYASSSITKTTQAPPAATLTPLQGWLSAAAEVGRVVGPLDLLKVKSTVRDGWTRLTVPGFVQEQQVRLRALALADGSVRPVFEANVVDVAGGAASAYTSLVDAVTGDVLHRENKVENFATTPVAMQEGIFPFSGAITETECGPMHPFELTDNATKSMVAVAALANTVNDAVVKIFGPDGALLVAGDLGTSPEFATYSADNIPAGTYKLQICPFAGAVFLPPGDYAASVTTSDSTGPSLAGAGFDPRWRLFPANPTLDSASETPSNSVIGCWLAGSGCTLSTGPLRNVQAPGPWDFLTRLGIPSLTTTGNNANTKEAWLSPLTPGGLAQAPISPTRRYTDPFQDTWNNSKCDASNLVPRGNDIIPSVTDLFANHNRMHDYSYYLGFNEQNYNMQVDNLGRGGVENDPEVGNVQAGALSGGQPSFQGRDNANQITLQDGIPGITNQYLFQPIAGAFYAPCTDGGLDMGIVGHEYTHAISNRMVAGPDGDLSSEQGGAMGESWSDLVAGEYQFSHGYKNGGNIWAIGAYATGNLKTAIRDYAINRNPLNFSDYGFDTTGPEVHADGEIWNGVNWEVRQALVKKWNARFPYDNKVLQLKCAQAGKTGIVRPQKCPGNRRWIQLMFDAFLLQQGATSFLDARDAMLASDRMRFGGENQKVIWDAFARRGMGKGASSPDADSEKVKPSFASPRSTNTKVTFNSGSNGRVFVGRYEARVTPVANTAKLRKSRESFTPGTYQMLFVSKSTGFERFKFTVKPGQRVKTVRIQDSPNFASAKAGAKVIGSTSGSRNPKFLIDGTEATNWGGVTEQNVDQSKPFVAVDLAGGKHRIRRVQVSSYLTPATTGADPVPLAQIDEDPDSGSRFTALRRFAVETCVTKCSSASAKWKRVFTSKENAFPSVRPRPVAPTLTLRSFKIRPTPAKAVRLVALENQCTGFAGYAGEQDNDPINDTDCSTASDRGTIVHAAEFQVF